MSDDAARARATARRHLVFGWWALAIFAGLGLTLEALHGLKLRAYLDVSNETRRLMWTLAHAHGALVAVLNVIFGLMLASGHVVRDSTSRCLIASGVLLPLGFFLGGIGHYGGDPGLGIVLVPVGAILLLAGIVSIARDAGRRTSDDAGRPDRRDRR